MSYVHIITQSGRIVNNKINEYRVMTAQQEQAYLAEGLEIREHVYKLQCGQVSLDVFCPEIMLQESTENSRYLILPEFLLPGRPYPIYVYLYAIEIYCTNPSMGQRGAAKMTRERFGLKTFSHTTLGRAMKKLEQIIDKDENASQNASQNKDPGAGNSIKSDVKFPTVEQTKGRRAVVASYLMKASGTKDSQTQGSAQALNKSEYRRPPYAGAFIDACHVVCEYAFLTHHCLLL